MAITPMRKVEPRPRRAVLAAFVFSCSVPPAVAEVEFEPTVSVGIAYTDNVALAAEGEESETVYQVMPGFDLSQQSRRLTSNVRYQMDAFRYASLSEHEIHNRFSGTTSFQLDPENFFLGLGGSRAQSIRDPRLAIPRNNLPLSSNRIDQDEVWVSPSFLYPLGNDVSASGSFRRSWVHYDDESLDEQAGFARDSELDALTFSLDNYRRLRGLTWAVRYDERTTEYEGFAPWEHRRASVEVGGWLNPSLRLFGSVGKESAWDQPLDPSLEDDFWDVGIATAPGERLSAEFAVGERTFGSSKRGQLVATFRLVNTTFSYAEEPTTQELGPLSFGALPDNVGIPGDLLSQAGQTERFIANRLAWNISFELRRTEIALDVFDEKREERTQLDGTPLDDLAQSGASLRATRRLGSRTTIHLSAARSSQDYEADDESELTSLSIGATYDAGPRTLLSLDYSYAKEESEGQIAGSDYTARLISLLLTRTF